MDTVAGPRPLSRHSLRQCSSPHPVPWEDLLRGAPLVSTRAAGVSDAKLTPVGLQIITG